MKEAATDGNTGPVSLSDVHIGETVHIKSVGGGRELHRRMLDMGLVRGTEIRMIRNAPLRDPVEVKVKGTLLAIRRKDACEILVERP